MFLEVTADPGSRVSGAIRQAAKTTGASFDYLLKTALQESNFDPGNRSTTSSASGLFQFIDQTWLSTLKQAGPALGYGSYAGAISKSGSGRYSVPDPAMRREIMNLRLDPTANAVMAGAFTQGNAMQLASGLGRKPTDGELYVAHVLGASGAVKLITAADRTPGATAAGLFPDAASANRAIFFDGHGSPRTAAQVYGLLTSKQNVTVSASGILAASTPPITSASIHTASDTSAVAAFAPEPPRYQSLFQTEGRGAVSSVVSQLWGSSSASLPASSAVTAASGTDRTASASGRPGAPLDLFRFLRPEIRSIAHG